jgi:hypothetical protein
MIKLIENNKLIPKYIIEYYQILHEVELSAEHELNILFASETLSDTGVKLSNKIPPADVHSFFKVHGYSQKAEFNGVACEVLCCDHHVRSPFVCFAHKNSNFLPKKHL